MCNFIKMSSIFSSGRRETAEQIAEAKIRAQKNYQRLHALKNAQNTTTTSTTTPTPNLFSTASGNNRYNPQFEGTGILGSGEDDTGSDVDDDDDDEDEDDDLSEDDEEDINDNLETVAQDILSSKIGFTKTKLHL